MAAKTESDYESDEEFQERISDELRTFYFPDFYDFACELEYELCKKRFDRAKKIIEIMVDKRNHNMYDPGDVSSFLGRLTVIVLRLTPAADLELGCSETLQIMSRHVGLGCYLSDRVRKRMAVRQASLGGGDDGVDTQRVLAGNSVFGCLGSGLCCTLIRASARGDLETVKSCLAVKEFKSFTKSTYCHHVRECAARIAAQYGHTHIVEAYFVEWEKRAEDNDWVIIDWLRRNLLAIACRSSNFDMIVSLLRVRNENWDQELSDLFNFTLVRSELYCTTDFLRKVSLVVHENRESYGDQINSRWLPEVLKSAIKFRSLPHVETVLDEMDPNRSGKVFTDHPWLMCAVFKSRCASILRCVLVRYPEVFIHNAQSDPVVLINEYCWPNGARLLVEAGAKCKGGVPAQHAGILTPSLEQSCRIAVRRSLKSPLLESVEKLPLPAKVKRRFLYQRS